MTARHSIAVAAATLCLLQACSTVAPSPQTKAMQIEPMLRLGHSGAASAVTYYQLGKFHQERNNLDAARASYLQSIALDPHRADARNALAVIHAKQGRLNDAAKLLQELVRDYPKDAYLQNNLAYVHYLQHDYGAALGALERALTIEPGNARAHANLDLVQVALIDKKNNSIAQDTGATAPTQPHTRNESAAQPTARQPLSSQQEEKAAALAIAEAREAVLSPTASESHRMPTVLGLRGSESSGTAVPERAAFSLTTSGLQVVQLQSNLIELRQHAAPRAAALNSSNAAETHTSHTARDMAPASKAPEATAGLAATAAVMQRRQTQGCRVDITNGNGIGGMAAKMRKALEAKGIPVAHLSNKKPFDTAVTEIQYRPGYLHEAEHIRRALQIPVVLSTMKHLSPSAEVQILLGKDSGAHLAMMHGTSNLVLNDHQQ